MHDHELWFSKYIDSTIIRAQYKLQIWQLLSMSAEVMHALASYIATRIYS